MTALGVPQPLDTWNSVWHNKHKHLEIDIQEAVEKRLQCR